MARPIRILAPTRYPWQFHGPRGLAHAVSIRQFVPFNKLSPKIEGITVFNPWPWQRVDLIHAFNRIPISTKPFIIGFESHLPRAFGLEQHWLFRIMARRLAAPKCLGIFAISEYAKRQFLRQHDGRPWLAALSAKLQVRYPNLPIPATVNDVPVWGDGQPMRLLFVGNHFARKGGTALLRMASMADARGLPIQVEIVSSLETGAASWVDPVRPAYFDADMALLKTLPNVTFYGKLPNAEVIALLKKVHFSLLPTFSDSFGFSAIESMAHGVPVMATAQGALPEFIVDGVNGVLLPLATDAMGEWKYIAVDRTTAEYEALFDGEVQALAQAMLTRIEVALRDIAGYRTLRAQARATAEKMFSAQQADAFWDSYYAKVLGR